jgi:glycerol-3-phosphate dehydrogenase (NAD(P)+)
MQDVAVLGGGSWGTVVAHLLALQGHRPWLWMRDPARADEMARTGRNLRYLPDMDLADGIRPTANMADMKACGTFFVMVPSKAMRETARQLSAQLDGRHVLVHGVKGLEVGSFKTMSTLLREETPCRRIGVLSGPNLAREVAAGQPSAALVASRYAEVQEHVIRLLRTPHFRVYASDDVLGTELGGTLKNILAIAAGVAHGLGFGENTRAFLLTRGIAEMSRLGVQMGARAETFAGLSGLGDALATCFSPLSRNFQIGYRLAQGASLEEAIASLGQTAEGVQTTRTVAAYAREHDVYMPITETVRRLLDDGIPIRQALQDLLETSRGLVEAERD